MNKIFLAACFLITIYAASAQVLTPSDADSKVAFVIKNMGINVDGTLKGLKGKIQFDPKNLAASSFDVTVDVNTINTGIDKRNEHLKKEEFFDATKYPTINIKTAKILSKGNSKYFAQGTLTIKGVSKNIQFDFIAKQQANGYTFSGGFPLNRRDYAVGGSSMIMSDDVKVNLLVAAKK